MNTFSEYFLNEHIVFREVAVYQVINSLAKYHEKFTIPLYEALLAKITQISNREKPKYNDDEAQPKF